MPDFVILVDFGASRIKAVLWSIKESCVIAHRECPSPTLQYGPRGEVTGNPENYWKSLEETAGQLAQFNHSVKDIWICSEMHGFMLADQGDFQPLTPYISWQDHRATYCDSPGLNTLERLRPIIDNLLFTESGMHLRPGLPIINLAAICKEVNFKSSLFLTLTDWLLVRGGEFFPKCHPSLACSTGLFSLKSFDWSEKLLRSIGISKQSLLMPSINKDLGSPIGSINLKERKLRVWGGIGDLQAAAHGIGFPHKASTIINLGTGSQVMVHVQPLNNDFEIRMTVDGDFVNAITHIPSGRALNTFAAFIDDCAQYGGGHAFFWRIFSELNADKVLLADPCVDLNVFDSSWRYSDGGRIVRIMDKGLSPESFIASLAKSWLIQYHHALSSVYELNQNSNQHYLLGGGLARRASFIPNVLDSLLGKKSLETKLRTGEETLEGLLILAEKFS
jgi:sugar (pentulose or hexulose) kinase